MVKIMYLSPVAHYGGHDEIFAEMAAENKLPGTEVHVCSFPDSIGKFSHIEYRSYEGIVTAGIIRAARAAARGGGTSARRMRRSRRSCKRMRRCRSSFRP